MTGGIGVSVHLRKLFVAQPNFPTVTHSLTNLLKPPKPNVEEVDDPTPAQSTLPSRTRIPGSKSLRPAQDIISRIKWDPTLSTDDFLIGYEDRFVGIKETELGKWKSEQTDEEFIPMHRIVWIRKKDKGEDGDGDDGKVWDRRRKVDLVFGSGVGKGGSERHPLT